MASASVDISIANRAEKNGAWQSAQSTSFLGAPKLSNQTVYSENLLRGAGCGVRSSSRITAKRIQAPLWVECR